MIASSSNPLHENVSEAIQLIQVHVLDGEAEHVYGFDQLCNSDCDLQGAHGQMRTVVQVITTVDSVDKAQDLANQLVATRRAGCVQVDGPIQSVYVWQGQICEAQEFRLTCKTLPDNCHELVDWLKQNHPYKLPEIIVAEESASAEYVDWLSAQLSRNESE